jgi:hypothetical protein
MANYAVKFRAEYKDQAGNHLRVDILKKGGTNDTLPYTLSFALAGIEDNRKLIGDPFRLRYRHQEDSHIIGSELFFSFVTKSRAQYAELLESNYKDYKAEFYINNSFYWAGWLVCDNVSTEYFGNIYRIQLSFNDGLAELDRYDISGGYYGSEVKGEQTLLFWIKKGIAYNDIPLDFGVILNTKEPNLMAGANDNALEKCTLPAERFIVIEHGKRKIDNSKYVISEILKPFNCKLFQAGGKYWIVNDMEVRSPTFHYAWNTLELQSVSEGFAPVEISKKKFERANELTRIRPLRRCGATFKNKNIPASLIHNSDFSTNDISFWNITAGGTHTASLAWKAEELSAYAFGDNCEGNIVFTNDISVEEKTPDDDILISFDYQLKLINYEDPNADDNLPGIEVEILRPDGSISAVGNAQLSTIKSRFEGSVKTSGTGFYKLRVIDRSLLLSTYNEIEYSIDNVNFTPSTEGENVTFDKFYIVDNPGTTAIDRPEDSELIIGDGLQASDIGNLKVGGTLTKEWNSYQKTERASLQHLSLINKLRLNQRFRNRVRLTALEQENLKIGYNSKIRFDYKTYLIKDLSVSFLPTYAHYEMEIMELPGNDITYETGVVTLTSVNGK